MLKIKDNVDLRKIGFDKDDEDFIWMDDYGIMADSNDRCISFGYMSHFIGNQNDHLDRLFDLIEAGLIEKVGDNQ